MITAFLLFLPLTAALLLVEAKFNRVTDSGAVPAWLAVHVYLPLIRAAALLTFVFVAYPRIFGLQDAPSLAELLAGGHYRFDQIINLVLLVALLLPLIPLLNRISGITLALQGMCATAMLASWLASSAGSELTLLPGGWLGLRILAVLFAARLAAGLLAQHFSTPQGRNDLIHEALRMIAQLPVVILYARFLGAQLAV